MRLPAAVLLLLVLLVQPAAADDGPGFRRTTPRSPLRVAASGVLFGIPHGRAWGLESRLLRIGAAGATVALDLGVDHPSVREAFVRIAWYDRDHGRPRQILIEDSAEVHFGVDRRIVLELHPPADAIAFRVRVLARVVDGSPASGADAVTASRTLIEEGTRGRPSLTRSR